MTSGDFDPGVVLPARDSGVCGLSVALSDRDESIEARVRVATRSSESLDGLRDDWIDFLLCFSIHPSSTSATGWIPFNEAGATVPAALASFSMLACWISSTSLISRDHWSISGI